MPCTGRSLRCKTARPQWQWRVTNTPIHFSCACSQCIHRASSSDEVCRTAAADDFRAAGRAFRKLAGGLKTEIELLDLTGAQVALPVNLVEPALKRGRVIFSWRDLRSWIKPAAAGGFRP